MNDHPIRLVVGDDLRRSRVTVLFRLLLATPHFVWLTLWGAAAFLAAVANALTVIVRGRSADSLHRFLAAHVRYSTHVIAFLFLVANPFPGFAGTPGYPVDVSIGPPQRQNRWLVIFRVFLAIPALVVLSALVVALLFVGVAGTLGALVNGRMPRGLRDLGALCVRYFAQTHAYVLGITDTYPRARQGLRPPAEAEQHSFEATA